MNDWERHFLPNAVQWLTTGNPVMEGTFNPIWTLPTLAPLFFLPPYMAYGFALLALGFYAYKRKCWWVIPIVGLSSPFVALVIYANIDWLVFLGLAFNDWRSPILLTIKPQSGILALLGMVKGMTAKQIILMLTPLMVLAGVLTLLYPEWLFRISSPSNKPWNLSIFPWLFPIGIYLGYRAWKNGDVLDGVLASLCIAPYFHFYSLTPALLLLTERNWKKGLFFSIVSWIPVILLWR